MRADATDIATPAARVAAFDWLGPIIEQAARTTTVTPSEFNQAMMELGSLICRPREPGCGECPVSTHCAAFAQGITGELPVKKKKTKSPHYPVAVGVVWRGDRVLVARRREKGIGGGMWEFPGGRANGTEADLAALCAAKVREETGVAVRVADAYGDPVKHQYSHYGITVTAFRCQTSGRASAKPLASQEVRWATLNELGALPFPAVTRRVIAQIEQVVATTASRSRRR
jgi:A/G-specific adenine glycosylase